jgi:hypothetical protein
MDFESRDPTRPQFWSERFTHDFTPWDRGAAPQALQDFVARSKRGYATLIPGCGAAYEVALLAEAGWEVSAIDFSPAAVAAARKLLGRWGERVRQADFFDFVPSAPLELIYERAFLCALPREKWPDIVRRWALLLPPDGLLAGFFYFDDAPKGPPFGADAGTLRAMLEPYFERLEDCPVTDSIPVFADKERWQVWRRRAE